jgi:hypothetical protein
MDIDRSVVEGERSKGHGLESEKRCGIQAHRVDLKRGTPVPQVKGWRPTRSEPKTKPSSAAYTHTPLYWTLCLSLDDSPPPLFSIAPLGVPH